MKPTGIVDNFGDLHLCCPFCKETIYFPLIGDERPTHCKKCGAKFEWSKEKKSWSMKNNDTNNK
ncbi:hypothetical protein [Veillonella montpellierensis]|uniref:hypothetical protein n=1 Tax=Veillonella montpellierensis TaxID=187328 RepID=UPI0023F6EB76|nr:hypothetical protein [Veillonella montpellierensis]